MVRQFQNLVMVWAALVVPFGLHGSEAVAQVVFPDQSWAIRTPADVGLDEQKLDEFARRVHGDGVIIQDGYLIKSWGRHSAHQDWASAAKPVLSTLLLLAVKEGKLPSVNAPVREAGWPLMPKDSPMTYRHLANMVSGYGRAEPPGEAWAYNDFAIQLYAQSLERVFGTSLDEAIRTRLAPLQFEDGAVFGSRRGGRGVMASPRDFARLGWLWLNEGQWKDNNIIPKTLFRESIRPGVPPSLPRSKEKGSDYLSIGTYGGGTDQTARGPGVYGFNFWFNQSLEPSAQRTWPALPHDAYQANGMWNRDTVTVIPSLRMVVAVRGASLGTFEPGRADGEANQNLKLLIDARSTAK